MPAFAPHTRVFLPALLASATALALLLLPALPAGEVPDTSPNASSSAPDDGPAPRAGMSLKPHSVGGRAQDSSHNPVAELAGATTAAASGLPPGAQHGPYDAATAAATAGVNSLLRNNRLVTYYGMDGAPGIGVLGQFPPDELVQAVKRQAAAVTAQGGKPALPALHLIVAQATAEPGSDGTFRRRIAPAVIQRYVDLTAANGMQLILDHQIGNSNLANEVAALHKYLEYPHVHLALDPEWATPQGIAPGSQMGSLDAHDINMVAQELARITQHKGLPNKVLMVHQFRTSMITQREALATSPLVDLVINMDGHGTQHEKIEKYGSLLGNFPRVFKGMQIFLKLDAKPFTPAQALALDPSPDVIVYL